MDSKYKYLLECKSTKHEPHGWMWWCPGCEAWHGGATDGKWTFDGNHDAPTFNPSFLVRGVIDPATDKLHTGVCPDAKESRCHTFVRSGKIEYLSDCTHVMAGQTVDMVPIDET